METVRVKIQGRDRNIGAMVKALAFEIGGPPSVAGTKKEVLETTGSYQFHFGDQKSAEDFRTSVGRYLPGIFATIE